MTELGTVIVQESHLVTYNKPKYNCGKEASNESFPGLLGRQLGTKETVLASSVASLNPFLLYFRILFVKIKLLLGFSKVCVKY